MENNTVEQAPADQREKRPVERSAAYPSIPAFEAIEFVGEISKHYTPAQIINREDIGAALKKASATIIRDVAAAAQYSLLAKHKNGYQISSLYKDYCNPISDKEKKKFLLDIIRSPTLYAELIEKYDGHAVPTELKTHLIRFHKITEKAAGDAAEVFFQTFRDAGVLSDNNILTFGKAYQMVSDPSVQYAEVVIEEKPGFTPNPQPQQPQGGYVPEPEKPPYLLNEGGSTDEKVRIPLSGKKVAYLQYPSDINAKDIQILLKQIELLELTIE